MKAEDLEAIDEEEGEDYENSIQHCASSKKKVKSLKFNLTDITETPKKHRVKNVPTTKTIDACLSNQRWAN